MRYLDFEKHIKKELEGSKEAVQMDALLASLNLGKQPKRKGFAFWIIVPFLILTLSVFVWKNMDFFSPISETELSKDAFSAKDSKNEVHILNANPNENESIFSVQEDAVNEDNTEVNQSKINNISESENTKTSSTKKKDLNSKDLQPSDHINTRTPAANDSSTEVYKKSNQLQPSEAHENNTLGTSYIQPKGARTSLNQESKGNASASYNSKLSRNLLDIADLDLSIDLIDEAEIDDALFSRMKINCPSFDNVGWHMALIPEIGVFLPRKTLKNNSLDETAAFEERLNSESTLEGIEFGLYGMLVRDNIPFYIKAGISYARITERMDLKFERIELDTTYDIISTTVTDNGDTITHIYGDIISETTFKGSNRQHYYIHLFDVPISVGYSTYLGGLDIGIEGGVKVNFMTRATGNLLTSEDDYTNLSLNRLFKNRIGLSYFGGLMIGRNFGRFGDFYIAPRFTYYPNEFNNQNNSISQKYLTIGLNAGVVYKIN